MSRGSFASLNTGNFSDDSPLNIHENRQRIARMLYTPVENFIIPHQTHGNRVLAIDTDFLNLTQTEVVEALYGVDAVVTNQRGVFLCVTTADCVPILLYDKGRGRLPPFMPAGRGPRAYRGELPSRDGAELWNFCTGSDRRDGAAISQPHYEVGSELVEAFQEAGFDLSDRAVSYREPCSGKWHIDLTEINRRELIRLGVPESQVEISGLCTFEREDLFFSARRQTIHSGRMLTGIKLEIRG